jgi:hypothetical protein
MAVMSARHHSQEAVSGPLAGRIKPGKASSNRSFGFVLAAGLGIVGCWPLIHGETPRYWLLTIAACFLVLAVVRPQSLTHLNRWWTRFGLLLGHVVSPVALALVYYLTIAPIGLMKRWFGKDTMGLRFDASAPTYWVDRDPEARPDESMKNQF